MATLDIEDYKRWIGRSITTSDLITPRLVECFRATFVPHLAPLTAGVPVGLHWCLAPEIAMAQELDPDGHPSRGRFLPAVSLPRRMWASGDVIYHQPLREEEKILKESEIIGIDAKRGKSGALCFVSVRHCISTERGLAIEEVQTIVYREAAGHSPAAPLVPQQPIASGTLVDIDTTMLFRYSALTFNSHRIHYDTPYTMTEELYPGLVIQGPLQATLLLNFATAKKGHPPRRFSFRSLSPAICPQTLSMQETANTDTTIALAAVSLTGTITMTAEAYW